MLYKANLLNEDEVAAGDREAVHVAWLQEPPGGHRGQDAATIEGPLKFSIGSSAGYL